MLNRGLSRLLRSATFAAGCVAVLPSCNSQTTPFHGAPGSEQTRRNPYAGDVAAAERGKVAFTSICAACHGASGEGGGNVPALRSATIRQTSDGELFWYITRGDVNNGMPSLATLPESMRWQIISYLRSIKDMGSSPPPKVAEETRQQPSPRRHRQHLSRTSASRHRASSARSPSPICRSPTRHHRPAMAHGSSRALPTRGRRRRLDSRSSNTPAAFRVRACCARRRTAMCSPH